MAGQRISIQIRSAARRGSRLTGRRGKPVSELDFGFSTLRVILRLEKGTSGKISVNILLVPPIAVYIYRERGTNTGGAHP